MQTANLYQETPERLTMRQVLSLSPGKFVGVTFRKLDGSVRKMSCRVANTDRTKKYLTVFDMGARGYRRVNLDCILSLRLNGIDMKVQ